MSPDLLCENTPKLQLAKKTRAKRVPSLKVLGKDPEVRAFYKIAYDYDLREKALQLLIQAIAKDASASPLPKR